MLAGVESDPRDMMRRVVYADWLDENDRPEEARFFRLPECTGYEFAAAQVAWDDSGGYDPAGWIAYVFDRGGRKVAALTSFGHCSCYDTWSSLNGGGVAVYSANTPMSPQFDWVGSVEGLVSLARRNADPRNPSRPPEYHDKHLHAVYAAVLEKYGEGRER